MRVLNRDVTVGPVVLKKGTDLAELENDDPVAKECADRALGRDAPRGLIAHIPADAIDEID